MKELIKKFIPDLLLKFYRNRISKYHNKSASTVFTEIYNSNHWKSSESISGEGSEIKQTESLINDLNKLLTEMNIATVYDLPCGDFN